MKRLFLLSFMAMLLFSYGATANGVAIKNASNSDFFQLISSNVEVMVYDQISIVISTQEFHNNTGELSKIKYAFPLPEGASGTGLRWNLGGTWYSAVISPSPQDTTLPGGGGGNTNLMDYLGDTPMFFDLLDSIPNDSTLIIELTYVQLLPYSFYEVEFYYPNDYSLIQSDVLESQHIQFTLESQRQITNLELLSHTANSLYYNDSTAGFEYEAFESTASIDYFAIFNLSPDELGLFSYSTFITDTAFDCDDYGNGFFTFIVEPDPQSQVIDKVFTLIIDRSGSMSGDKIVQARDAATYIVNNLNEGDYFNIVDFSSDVTKLFQDHAPFNISNQTIALDYINDIYSGGLTNISGAFSAAIPDFASNDTTLANIIIFFTDGEATTGITSTEGILQHIQDEINFNEVQNLMINSFGIGEYANQSLLSQIASQNNGMSTFLGDDELLEIITTFYLMIRNPVLLNTEMSVNPSILTQIFPDPLDNLYLGQQLIVVGRYASADSINVTFSGDALGQPISYEYGVNLADTTIPLYQFLMKLWAMEKMNNLFILYHTYDPNSPEAEEIKNEIIDISICYTVISPFTSYTGGGGPPVNIEHDENSGNVEERQSYAYPNPFSGETQITFQVVSDVTEEVVLKIYNSLGKLIRTITIMINGKGEYSISWDGRDSSGSSLPGGYYFYSIDFNGQHLSGKIIKQ